MKRYIGMNVIMRHYTERDFNYSTPAINGVKIWEVRWRRSPFESLSAQQERDPLSCKQVL